MFQTFHIRALAAAYAAISLLTLLPSARSLAQAAPSGTIAGASTRALYVYRRDDAASTTRIAIDAAHVGRTPISPNIFGNFIEHLSDAIYQCLWADVLLNPNLERSDPKETAPPYWTLSGTAAWRESADSGYLSQRSVRISAPDGLLSEQVYPPVYRISSYTLTLYTRAASASPGRISVALRSGDNPSGPVLAQTVLAAGSKEWTKQTIHWIIPARGLAVGQAAQFVIAYRSGGSVDVDQVELFPDDNVDGMDPVTLRLAREWHIPILRLAGNFASGYDWRTGVGPHAKRPSVRNPAWGGIESNHFGTDEFLDLCRIIGATPQIGANAGDGTPQEAAAWVKYCNRGQERVPVWEVGNELYGSWQIGHTDVAGNAARYVAFRAAMLQADPRIQLIATGKGDEFLPDGLQRDREWNTALLKAATAEGGKAPDWISIHPLVWLPGNLDSMPYEQRWQSAMAHPAFLDKTQIPQLIDTIITVEGPHARTRIAPTEWGIILGGPTWKQGPNHNNVGGVIYNALALNTFLRNSDWVTLTNSTALLHGGCIAKDHGVDFVMPEYYTGKLYALAAPSLPVSTVMRGPGQDVPQRGFLASATDVPDVDAFSALAANRGRLVVFLVNRRLDISRPVTLDVSGFAAARSSAQILTAANPQTENTWQHPNNVVPRPFAVLQGAMSNELTMTLPPHSMVVLTLARAAANTGSSR